MPNATSYAEIMSKPHRAIVSNVDTYHDGDEKFVVIQSAPMKVVSVTTVRLV